MENSGFESNNEVLLSGGIVSLIPLDEYRNSIRECYKFQFFGKWLFIKALKADLEVDSRYIEAFRKEQEIGMQLDHPNLPKYVFTPDLLPGRTYVAMEYIDGIPLGEFLESNRNYFSHAGHVEKFIREISSGLDYLHSHQILHLDLKPDNVLITRVGNNVKIIDFGFSKTDSFTGSAGFTSGFMSPEREVSKEKTEAADYYGLGKLLEYIRTHTPSYPSKKFKKLESGLLAADMSGRIHNKREIDRLLPEKSPVPVLPLGLTLIVVIGLVAGFIFMRPNEVGAEDLDKVEVIPEGGLKEIKEVGANLNTGQDPLPPVERKEEVSGPPERKALEVSVEVEKTPETWVPIENSKKPLDREEFARQYNDLEKVIDEELSKQLIPIGEKINIALANRDFSEATYKRLEQEIVNGASCDLKPNQFLPRYPLISEDTFYDMIGLRMQELDNKFWKKEWVQYKREFKAYQKSVQ